MNTLLIIRFPLQSAWGGEEKLHLLLANEFQRKGIKTIFCGSCAPLLENAQKAGFLTWKNLFFRDITSKIQIFFSPFILPIFFLFGVFILTYFRVKKGETVLMLTYIEKITWTPIAKFLKFNIVWGHHAPFENWFYKNPYRFLWKYFSQWAVIITPSDFMKKKILDFYPKAKVKVVYNPISKNLLPITKNNKKTPSLFFIGTASRLSPEKGLIDMVEAAKILGDPFQFLIAGSGPLEKDLKEKSPSNIHFLGFLSEIQMKKQFWENLDCFLLPSHQEPFGIVLLEAMQNEIPIIATNVDGIPEVVQNNGILVPPKDPEKLAKAIKILAKDKNLQKDLIERGKKREKDFSVQEYQEKMKKILFF